MFTKGRFQIGVHFPVLFNLEKNNEALLFMVHFEIGNQSKERSRKWSNTIVGT